MIELLITKGASVRSQDKDGRGVLHYAVLGAGHEAALLLISKGAVVDARDRRKWTPLYLASVNDQPRMVELLVNQGANVNPKVGPSPFGRSCNGRPYPGGPSASR